MIGVEYGMHIKHFFFDLDGTLARSRTPMSDEHRPLFRNLCERFDVLVTSGTAAAKMRVRLPNCPYYLFAENGNCAFDKNSSPLWKNTLTDAQRQMILELIERMKAHLAFSVRDEKDLVEVREVQITYSLIGHNENLEKKEAFDPKGEKRRQLLVTFAKDMGALEMAGIEIKVGGTTGLDFFPLGKNKASNIVRLMEQRSWQKTDAIYIGDAMYPGGNDEVMIGVVPTKEVKNPAETFACLREIGAI